MNKTTEKIIKELAKYPPDSIVYAYEGEKVGILIADKNHKEIGFIETDVF